LRLIVSLNFSKQLEKQGDTKSFLQSVSCEVIRFLPSDTAWFARNLLALLMFAQKIPRHVFSTPKSGGETTSL
jgi:hypothetical protein